MNGKQITVLVLALMITALILWRNLPIEFPLAIVKMFVLAMKLCVVLILAIIAYVVAGEKKKTS